jgi:class 3 adenylate cyclase
MWLGVSENEAVQPPSGTVTLLFTDIEGSTRFWEEAPEVMSTALTRHDELVRAAIGGSSGYVFKALGDGFCATFTSAGDALRAATEIQSAINAEPWADPVRLKVRIGLHTGECEERDGSYFGAAVNRTGRLMSTAHGGQIVLSGLTAQLVRDSLPTGAELRDLGRHRLKDLGQPEAIYEFDPPGASADFPPLRSLDNPDRPNNLPVQVNSFVGRERELADTRELVRQHQLVTLSGPGGSGKTRLAIQVGAELIDRANGGVWLVELGAVEDPELVAPSVATVLGVREEAGRSVMETLTEALRERRLLLILDNCEHLLTACAQLVNGLIRSCPLVHILATPREPIGLSAQHLFTVPTLSLPPGRQVIDCAESGREYESVQLSVDRAVRIQPSFTLNDANAAAVVSVCRRLDGIPLAIELAAARLRSLSIFDIDDRLDDRFSLLGAGGRSGQARQQTLRALVDWSYGLLDESERTIRRALRRAGARCDHLAH